MISIIIATYNSSPVIQTALDSLLDMTYTDWECIIVDGKSKDTTTKVLDEYVSKDSRFRYISEPDRGIYDALNKGIKLSRGEWIYILGSDDKVCKNSFSNIMRYADDYDVICGNIIFSNNGIEEKIKASSDVSILKKMMIYSHQAIICRKTIFMEIGDFDLRYKISADYDFILRAYLKSYKFKYLDEYVAVFNTTGASNTWYNKDLYYIRRNNKSVSFLTNIYIIFRKFISTVKYELTH